MSEMLRLLDRARTAAHGLARSTTESRNKALDAMARALAVREAEILLANRRDVDRATELSPALRDRLTLTPDRVKAMIRALDEVRALPDPLGVRRALGRGRTGIEVYRQRVPLGVVAIVYEARPNVTAECAALTVKSGNAVVLRGGKEAIDSNRAIAAALAEGLHEVGLPDNAVILVEDTSREAVTELLGASGRVDLVIPRGGAGLMSLVDAHARVPVIRHGQGICHVYVDATADRDMAVDIVLNSKVQRPGVCNALETLIVHASRRDVLEALGPRLRDNGVELRADPESFVVLNRAQVKAVTAKPEDFDTEFLGLVLAIRSVPSLDAALAHIQAHGTHHTASIVTSDPASAERFLREVDASCVLWNASTRLNDGGELGLGAEMGISTSKMHAYGPMGLVELTAEKLVVVGTGQVRG